MKTTKTICNLLMASAVLGLSMSLASCFDNIDNNGGITPEEQEEVVLSKADKYWSVVSQLVSTDDYTPDYEGKTFESVYGIADEGEPTTRIVYTNNLSTAAKRFADIVEKDDIDENTQSYTFDDPDIGTLTYTKGDDDGAILATVDVNIKEIPSLKKILYVPGASSNGHFDGKAYYRFGDVVSRQTIDYDGNTVTEYWVCVRPAFGPEGKEESHWVCLNVLPKKNVYHYEGSNDTDYYLPTGIGTNTEHMKNLAEMLYAMNYPDTWYQNVTQYANSGLEMFHDFSAANIKYHNQLFWKSVQRAWKKNDIYKLALNLENGSDICHDIDRGGLHFLYKGYSWWTRTSWNCTLYVAEYASGEKDKYKNMHEVRFVSAKSNMKNIRFDCREMGDSKNNYNSFFNNENDSYYWAVRHATGKELCANGRYDVKQPLNGCTEVYRYYRDVESINDLSEDPEVTGEANNAPTDGQGTYMLGDVVMDEANNRWFCINGSPWSPMTPNVKNHNAWFVSADFFKRKYFVMNEDEIISTLPSEEEIPELAARLMDGFIDVAASSGEAFFKIGIDGQLGSIMQHVKDYAGFDWYQSVVARDTVWTFTSKGKTYESASTALMFNLAYRDNEGKIALARIIKDQTQSGNKRGFCVAVRKDGSEVKFQDIFTRVYKYYQEYNTDKMRNPTEEEKYLGMNSWCLPWVKSDKKMYLSDLLDPNIVGSYSKTDKWVTLPLHHVGTTNTKREKPRTEPETLINIQEYISDYDRYGFTPKLGMYNEPIILLRVMKVEDKGGKQPNLKSTDNKKLEVVHLQNDANLYSGMTHSYHWVNGYSNISTNCFFLDDVLYDLPPVLDKE